MPKLKYLQSTIEKRADILAKKKKALKGEIHGAVAKVRAMYDLTQDEFAAETGINRGTLSNRLKSPENFSIEELFKIQNRFPELGADIVRFMTS